MAAGLAALKFNRGAWSFCSVMSRLAVPAGKHSKHAFVIILVPCVSTHWNHCKSLEFLKAWRTFQKCVEHWFQKYNFNYYIWPVCHLKSMLPLLGDVELASLKEELVAWWGSNTPPRDHILAEEQQVNAAVVCHAQDKDTVLCEEVTGWMAYLLRHGTKQMTDVYNSSGW